MIFTSFERATTTSQIGHGGHKDKPKHRVGMNHFLLARRQIANACWVVKLIPSLSKLETNFSF